MKTLKSFITYLKRNPQYVGDFANAEDVFNNFNVPFDKKVKFCYASYVYEDYSGSAFVIYYRTDTRKFYELYGSHCSCFGLEDQWTKDEEICFKALQLRVDQGHFYDDYVFVRMFQEFKEGKIS